MADYETNYAYAYPKEPTMWVCFINDIFMIWDHGEEELLKFIGSLNECHESIKFTHEYSKNQVHPRQDRKQPTGH